MNRRSTLKLLGASAIGTSVAGLTGCTQTQATPLNLDPNNPEDLHYMHKKLAYTLDDRLVYWNINAVRMGFKDGKLTPFWDMHVGIIYKFIHLEEFRYESQVILKIFYTDLKTGELLEVFDNPYTGEQREVAQPRLFKLNRIHGLRGVERAPEPQSDAKQGAVYIDNNIGPARIIGDDVWINGDMVERREIPNRLGRLLQVNDWSTYHGSWRDLTDPTLTSAPATHTFNDLNTFNHDWIGMGDIRAWSISRGVGRKNFSVEAMPEPWKKFVAQTHPELLTDTPGFK